MKNHFPIYFKLPLLTPILRNFNGTVLRGIFLADANHYILYFLQLCLYQQWMCLSNFSYDVFPSFSHSLLTLKCHLLKQLKVFRSLYLLWVNSMQVAVSLAIFLIFNLHISFHVSWIMCIWLFVASSSGN